MHGHAYGQTWFDLSFCHSSTFRVIFGRFIDDRLTTGPGFLNRSFISSLTANVAVAVNAMIGTVGNSVFNCLSSLTEFLKSFHSVSKWASSIAISAYLLHSINECILDCMVDCFRYLFWSYKHNKLFTLWLKRLHFNLFV